MTEPDDRELDQYLKGDSKLSRRYREASRENAPPELDEAILAQARAELKRKPPSLNRYLAPVALAASVVLGVNLAWNLYQVEPVPEDLAKAQSRDDAFVPSPPPPPATVPAARAPERKTNVQPAPASEAPASSEDDRLTLHEDLAERQREQESAHKQESEQRGAMSARRDEAPQAQTFATQPAAGAAAPSQRAMADDAPALSEGQKVDRLIGYVRGLQGAVFVRNGKEYGPADAAKHLQLKREKAGDRVRTADDFIRLCASHSSVSGDAYLIRFADGRTRTAEDVLREELARIEGR